MELTWGAAEREAKEKRVAALSSLDRGKQRRRFFLFKVWGLISILFENYWKCISLNNIQITIVRYCLLLILFSKIVSLLT